VYLADFGIVRETTQTGLTATGVAVGTPAYMAPERFAGRTVDHRVDIYALDCILYEMLTGNPPYAGADYPALLFQHLNAQPAPQRGAARSPPCLGPGRRDEPGQGPRGALPERG
jgi:eukaryotic-like serine/threonine-protein kinase